LSLLLLLLAIVPASNDEALGALVLAGLLAFGWEAPGRRPMLAALCTATVRVINRVHRDAAVVRHAALPALTTGLSDRGVHIVWIGHCTDRRHAAAVHEALFRGVEAQNDVILVAADDLRVAASRARDLPTLSDLDLDIVDYGSDRDIRDRHRVARLHVRVLGCDYRITNSQALRRQDVGEFAVLIFDQRDEAGAIRIIFQTFDGRRHVEFLATEIDAAVSLLVAAATESRCDTAVVVAPAGRILAFGERLDRRSLMKGRAIDDHQLALARRYRIVGLQRHRNAPLQSRGHVDSMTFFKGHDRAFHIGLLTDLVTENFPLSRPRERV